MFCEMVKLLTKADLELVLVIVDPRMRLLVLVVRLRRVEVARRRRSRRFLKTKKIVFSIFRYHRAFEILNIWRHPGMC